ncbi:hypothetical protein ACU686_26820 [Yinghuangia aomiensis]
MACRQVVDLHRRRGAPAIKPTGEASLVVKKTGKDTGWAGTVDAAGYPGDGCSRPGRRLRRAPHRAVRGSSRRRLRGRHRHVPRLR